MENRDDLPIAQAADVSAHWTGRLHQSINSAELSDRSVIGPADVLDQRAFQANIEWDDPKIALNYKGRFVLQYAIAYESIRELDGELFSYLAEPSVFATRVQHNQRFGARVSIFK